MTGEPGNAAIVTFFGTETHKRGDQVHLHLEWTLTVDEDRRSAARVWKQGYIPVIYRQCRGLPLLIRLPFGNRNMDWLKGERRRRPVWVPRFKCRRVPGAWFDDPVDASVARFGKVYAIQPYRETEKCAPACWTASGYDCQCSCMGANHGAEYPEGKWRVVSETCAVRFGERRYGCRLIARAEAFRASAP